MERRLAAILAADVVGYSHLMEQDEAGTLLGLKDRRNTILEPMFAKHHGRIIKLMGDGVLAEFASAVDAVHCAVDIQKQMGEANTNLSDERVIIFRIGINLGDVVVENGDLYGDGVNIAARLEGIASPGAVLVSAAVHEQVERKLPFSFKDLGNHTLKNLTKPVRVYGVVDGGVRSATGMELVSGRAFPLPTRPSVAVLPFDNLSGDPEQRYFSDGLTEDIITELSRFRQLFVIARHSSFQYRDNAIDVKRIGLDLGVQYIVEGSVRRIGESVRISAQLVDAITGNHLWAERYDQDQKDIFNIQDKVVRAIVVILPGRIEDAGTRLAHRKRPENLAAYDYFLRGVEYHLLYDYAHNATAREMFEKAIAIEPDLAPAYAWLATQHMRDWSLYQSVKAKDEAFKLARRGVALDPNDSVCQMMLGYVYLFQRQLDDAEFHLNQAVSLNPNDPNNAVTLAWLLAYLGRAGDALNWIDKAFRLNPYPPPWYFAPRGIVLYAARRYADAGAALRRIAANLDPLDLTYLIASYGQLGRIEDAQRLIGNLHTQYHSISCFQCAANEPFSKSDDLEHLREGLLKAGLRE